MTKRILVNLKLKILEIAVTQLFIYQENIFILLYSIQNISIFFLKKILQFFRVLMLRSFTVQWFYYSLSLGTLISLLLPSQHPVFALVCRIIPLMWAVTVTYASLESQLVKFITEQQVEIIHCFWDIVMTEKQKLFRNIVGFRKTNEGHWTDSYLKTDDSWLKESFSTPLGRKKSLTC